MKKPTIVIGILMTLLLMLGLALPASAQVEPPEVEEELGPGELVELDKMVTTPKIPPKPDIYFLADTTGSMGSVIENLSSNAYVIMNAISAVQPDAWFGVGNYKDFPHDAYAFQHQVGITNDIAAVAASIGAWIPAGGGYDGPEGQFYALTEIATDPAIGWRPGSTRIVVWIGDAPAHDPVPPTATGYIDNITEVSVIDALQAANIRIVAISTLTGAYLNGLDDNPTVSGGDYASYYGITENGNAGQAGRIATATGGIHLTGVDPDEIVDKIIEGLEAIKTDVWGEVNEIEGLSVKLDPEVHYKIESGTTVIFKETITVDNDVEPCTWLETKITFYANTSPDTRAEIGVQTIRIHVVEKAPPEVECIEAMNPHGKNVPGGKASGQGQGNNPDGFYELIAVDDHDPEPQIYVGTSDYNILFGPYHSGIIIKFTEAPGVAPSHKKMGSDHGQAGVVVHHITLPTYPVIWAVDVAGNTSPCIECLVPPPPK